VQDGIFDASVIGSKDQRVGDVVVKFTDGVGTKVLGEKVGWEDYWGEDYWH
jgi:hypothetical protein